MSCKFSISQVLLFSKDRLPGLPISMQQRTSSLELLAGVAIVLASALLFCIASVPSGSMLPFCLLCSGA
eukprot:1161387-Pelagomonas_calceolata.AAC.14